MTRRCALAQEPEHEALLDITFTASSDNAIIGEVSGEIDLRTAETLRSRLLAMADAGFSRIVLDFTDVRFCDASGLGALVAVRNRMREQGGDIKLARVRPAQRRLFRITGLDRLFMVYDSVDQAVIGARSATPTSLS
jgi:anti-sigma B factor antagonist